MARHNRKAGTKRRRRRRGSGFGSPGKPTTQADHNLWQDIDAGGDPIPLFHYHLNPTRFRTSQGSPRKTRRGRQSVVDSLTRQIARAEGTLKTLQEEGNPGGFDFQYTERVKQAAKTVAVLRREMERRRGIRSALDSQAERRQRMRSRTPPRRTPKKSKTRSKPKKTPWADRRTKEQQEAWDRQQARRQRMRSPSRSPQRMRSPSRSPQRMRSPSRSPRRG